MKAEIQEELQEVHYIKPNNEIYRIGKRESIPQVRKVPLWVLIPLLLLMVLGGYLVFSNIGIETTGQIEYQVGGEVDYQVYLKENEYYKESYLGPGREYIASIISAIRTDFDYTLEADEKINAIYRYEIVATAVATDKNDKSKILYEKSDVLKTGEIKQVENGTVDIKENATIDYGQYNEYMRGFRSDFGISANCYLDLKLIIRVNGEIENEDILMAHIPLSDQTISIGISTDKLNRIEKVGTAKTELYAKDMPLLIVGGVMAVSSLMISIIVIHLYATRFGDNWYAEAEHKIFKHFDTRIVTVSDTFKEPEDTVRISSFTELLDASDTEGAPIQYYDVVPGFKSYFVVKGANTTYRYTLSRAYQDKLRQTGEKKEF